MIKSVIIYKLIVVRKVDKPVHQTLNVIQVTFIFANTCALVNNNFYSLTCSLFEYTIIYLTCMSYVKNINLEGVKKALFKPKCHLYGDCLL